MPLHMLPLNSAIKPGASVGRFAPSPTGMLHTGSLVTAVASYLFAKSQGGKWLLRMEDLDTERNVPGAADAILRQLEHLGLYWDDPVVYQSTRMEFYADTMRQLIRKGDVYRCTCSRREIAAAASRHTASGPVYSGRCRHLENTVEEVTPRNIHQRGCLRLKVDNTLISFADILHGQITQQPALEAGDFILKRADGIFAYQFATPLDDAAQHIRQVIRGMDLLDSTPRQIYLLQRLGASIPAFGHIPLVLDAHGNKISKSTQQLRKINSTVPVPFGSEDLFKVLEFLGQAPPSALFGSNSSYASTDGAQPEGLLRWALHNFNPAAIPLKNMPIHTSM
ncbi:MAG: tRNA glutamyl-Q(34) synthetase GluQRS [Desulfuromonadaceae bacterium]|nr:tRNA glutamyl-Q(34) synthetase GluQRS [Desulfuromonadaceae bacterium]